MTLNVLALATYPEEAAATRFRLTQFVPRLSKHGISLEVDPFLDSAGFAALYDGGKARAASAIACGLGRRLSHLQRVRTADVVLVQREAALIGPPAFEALASQRRPMVLDLDDPTWIPYDSPTYGRAARLLKWPGKTDWLIRRAAVVTCGSRAIAANVEALGGRARTVPTVVDTEIFQPASHDHLIPTIGWIGTHSTYPYLESILPALRTVATRRRFRLVVVGAGDVSPDVPGADVEIRRWSLEREVGDFQMLDIGLYPLLDDGWASGKSGFKAIQYLAVGVPYVVTPLGETRQIGEAGVTHVEATTEEEWVEALTRLLDDAELRHRMGRAGRDFSESHYTLDRAASALAAVLHDAAR